MYSAQRDYSWDGCDNRSFSLDQTQCSASQSYHRSRSEENGVKQVFSQMVKNMAYNEITQKVFTLKESFLKVKEQRLKEQRCVQECWVSEGRKFNGNVGRHKERITEVYQKYT